MLLESQKIIVAHIRDSSGVYGAERVILALGKNPDKTRFSIMILCLRNEKEKSENLILEAKRLGIDVTPVDVRGRIDFNGIMKVRSILREKNVKILHCHDFKSNFYGLLASINLDIKRVVTMHGSTRDSFLKKVYLFLDEMFVYRFFNKIIAVSWDISKQLKKKGIKSRKIQVIQNGLDFHAMGPGVSKSIFETPLNIPDGDKVIGVIGRLYPDKGHRYFLDAFSRVCRTYPCTKALIVGEGPLKNDIKKKIIDLSVEENVILSGFRSDMEYIYSRIDLLVIPSLREGLPYVLLEAMGSKVPVLATAVGDIPLLVENGVTGYLVSAGESEGLEKGMMDLLSNPIKAKEMAERGYRVVLEKFSAERMVRNTETLYMSLVN